MQHTKLSDDEFAPAFISDNDSDLDEVLAPPPARPKVLPHASKSYGRSATTASPANLSLSEDQYDDDGEENEDEDALDEDAGEEPESRDMCTDFEAEVRMQHPGSIIWYTDRSGSFVA